MQRTLILHHAESESLTYDWPGGMYIVELEPGTWIGSIGQSYYETTDHILARPFLTAKEALDALCEIRAHRRQARTESVKKAHTSATHTG